MSQQRFSRGEARFAPTQIPRDLLSSDWLRALLVVSLLWLMAWCAPTVRAADESAIQVVLQVDLPGGTYTDDELVATAVVVALRLQAFGIDAALVQVVGTDKIQVQLPKGFAEVDVQQVINTMTQTGLLEFVDFSNLGGQAAELVGKQILTSEQVRIEAARGAKPDATLLPNPLTGRPFQTVLTGAAIKQATAQLDQNSQNWNIAFELTADGGKIFGDYTAAHIGQPLAIVLDSTVLSAPIIQSTLTDQGVITGNFTKADAQQLAAQLSVGRLPLPLVVASVETVRTVEVK